MFRLTKEQLFTLLEALPGEEDLSKTVLDVVQVIKDQCAHPNHADDLVETIAKILASPKTKNALNGTFLDMMRAAVLSPTELAKLQALSDKYQTCKGCSRELANGEIACLHNQDPFCLTCIMPAVMYCPHCKALKELPTGIFRVIQKAIKECKVCATTAAGAPVTPIPDQEDVIFTRQNAPTPPDIGRWVTTIPTLAAGAGNPFMDGGGGGNPYDIETTPPTTHPAAIPALTATEVRHWEEIQRMRQFERAQAARPNVVRARREV